MSKKSGRLLDLREAYHHLVKVVLFLDRNDVEDQVMEVLKVAVKINKLIKATKESS